MSLKTESGIAWKDPIREYALNLGIDDLGFASVSNYNSPRSKKIEDIFPEGRSMIIMVIREMSHCESPNPQIAMSGRIDAMEFARHCVYSLARHVEKNYGGKSMGIPFSYPLEMDPEKNGSIADISLRHAAVAAGLGAFGRHNLVIHPSLGSRVLFCGILTDIEFESDPPCEKNPCINCNICVKECPAGALDEEGRTDAFKCLKVSQPYGLGKSVAFWNDFIKKTPWEQTKMFFTKDYWQMYQAQFIGFQYFCFNCYVVCPVGKINKQSS